MDRLYIPDHNHIFRKLSRMSSGDFPRLPGLKYDDIIRKICRKVSKKRFYEKMDRDPSHPMQFFTRISMVVMNFPYLSYSSCCDEHTKLEQFVTNKKNKPMSPLTGQLQGMTGTHTGGRDRRRNGAHALCILPS